MYFSTGLSFQKNVHKKVESRREDKKKRRLYSILIFIYSFFPIEERIESCLLSYCNSLKVSVLTKTFTKNYRAE